MVGTCEAVRGAARAGDRVLVGGGLEPLWPELLPRLADFGGLVGPAPRHASLLADPKALTARMGALPMPLPPRRFGCVPARGRWLVKPALRAGGTQVRVGEAGARLPAGWYAEPYIAGRTVSICALRVAGALRILGAARHLALGEAAPFTRQALAVHADPAACGLDPEQAHETAARVANRLDYAGIFGLDLVCCPDAGPTLVDVNLRPPASLEWMPGAPAALAGLLVRDLPAVAPAELPAWRGGAVVTATRAFQLDAVAAQMLARWGHGSAVEPGWVHDLPATGQCFAAGSPVCTVSALAEDEATLSDALAIRSRQVLALVAGRSPDTEPA